MGANFGVSAEPRSVDQRVAKIETTLQELANVLVLTARQMSGLLRLSDASIDLSRSSRSSQFSSCQSVSTGART